MCIGVGGSEPKNRHSCFISSVAWLCGGEKHRQHTHILAWRCHQACNLLPLTAETSHYMTCDALPHGCPRLLPTLNPWKVTLSGLALRHPRLLPRSKALSKPLMPPSTNHFLHAARVLKSIPHPTYPTCAPNACGLAWQRTASCWKQLRCSHKWLQSESASSP